MASVAAIEGGWLAKDFVERFESMLDRALARVHPQASGPIERITFDHADPEGSGRGGGPARRVPAPRPRRACCTRPTSSSSPRSAGRPGKPVNFVPVIDADVRRWWRSDSLWQAHDEAYGAEQVIVIPGPVSVAGITVKDEPVADLLDRFEAAITEEYLRLDTPAIAATSRSTVGAGTTPCSTPRPPPRTWCGPVGWSRTRCTASSGSPTSWCPTATTQRSSGCPSPRAD